MKFKLEIDLTHFMLEDGQINYTALSDTITAISYKVDNGYDKGEINPPRPVVCGKWCVE